MLVVFNYQRVCVVLLNSELSASRILLGLKALRTLPARRLRFPHRGEYFCSIQPDVPPLPSSLAICSLHVGGPTRAGFRSIGLTPDRGQQGPDVISGISRFAAACGHVPFCFLLLAVAASSFGSEAARNFREGGLLIFTQPSESMISLSW